MLVSRHQGHNCSAPNNGVLCSCEQEEEVFCSHVEIAPTESKCLGEKSTLQNSLWGAAIREVKLENTFSACVHEGSLEEYTRN